MSLPIRQGKLFPTAPEQSPKFGRHLGTIKYRFDIAPLFISHVYQQYSSRDWARGVTTLFGVKAKVSVFHVDLHQREQEMTKHRPELGGSKKVLHKPFYEAEVDCTDINLRALGGLFSEPDKRLVSFEAEPDEESEEPSDIFSGDCSIKDRDLDWVDMNDFVELDWAPPEESEPKIKLLQALACPRFDYYRRIDSRRERKARNSDAERADGKQDTEDLEDEEGDEQSEMERSKFGNELSHTCLVGQATRESPPPPRRSFLLNPICLSLAETSCFFMRLLRSAAIFAIQRELAEGRIRVLQAELDALEHSRDAQQPTADNAAEKSFESTRPAENAEKVRDG